MNFYVFLHFNFKCYDRILDGFKKEKNIIYIFRNHLASVCGTNYRKTQMIIGRPIRRQ